VEAKESGMNVPINPKTGKPYFWLDANGFGNGWSLGPAFGWISPTPLEPGNYRHPMYDVHDDGEGNLVTDAGEKIGCVNYATGFFSTSAALKVRPVFDDDLSIRKIIAG
jgi:hypothetical protein